MTGPMDEAPTPGFDQALADTYVGRYILVGITYVDHDGTELERHQLHGVIEAAGPDGIRIALRGVHTGTTWVMPPSLEAIAPAKPGHYRLHATNEVVADPDLLSTWSVTRPAP